MNRRESRSNVTSFKPAIVCTAGSDGWLRAAARRDEAVAHPLPTRVSFAQGPPWVPYSTAWRALVHARRARAGETLLVHGASGGVGIAAVELGRSHGFVSSARPARPKDCNWRASTAPITCSIIATPATCSRSCR